MKNPGADSGVFFPRFGCAHQPCEVPRSGTIASRKACASDAWCRCVLPTASNSGLALNQFLHAVRNRCLTRGATDAHPRVPNISISRKRLSKKPHATSRRTRLLLSNSVRSWRKAAISSLSETFEGHPHTRQREDSKSTVCRSPQSGQVNSILAESSIKNGLFGVFSARIEKRFLLPCSSRNRV
jgi:hypothetical protein